MFKILQKNECAKPSLTLALTLAGRVMFLNMASFCEQFIKAYISFVEKRLSGLTFFELGGIYCQSVLRET